MGPTPGRRPSPWKCQLRRRGGRFHLENSGRWGSSGSPVPHGQAVRDAALGLGCLRHPDRDLGSDLLSCPSKGRVSRPLSAWELAEWSRLEPVCIRLRGVAVSRRQLCQQGHCHGHPQRVLGGGNKGIKQPCLLRRSPRGGALLSCLCLLRT